MEASGIVDILPSFRAVSLRTPCHPSWLKLRTRSNSRRRRKSSCIFSTVSLPRRPALQRICALRCPVSRTRHSDDPQSSRCAAAGSPSNRAPFKKVLYLKQAYPDNYVDASFLANLQRNGEHSIASRDAVLTKFATRKCTTRLHLSAALSDSPHHSASRQYSHIRRRLHQAQSWISRPGTLVARFRRIIPPRIRLVTAHR